MSYPHGVSVQPGGTGQGAVQIDEASGERGTSGSAAWVIQVRDRKQDRWREVAATCDQGEARFALFNYVMDHPARIVRVLPPDDWKDSE